ncbi:MAG: ATP-binding protein [Kiritimatiellae bacterium]|nr:ATP-binding protein [Kiritimatiellia bacterium]
MNRDILDKIDRWNSSTQRKPLILMGARQTGKTWLLRAFSQKRYSDDTVFVDLHDNEPLRNAIEEGTTDAVGILELIATAMGRKIVPGRTLLVLDEIQESPRTLTSLKYFHEKMPNLAIMAAGSLLGLALNREERRSKEVSAKVSFPVGKVSFLEVLPMSFGEFLDAMGEEEKRVRLKEEAWSTISAFHETFANLLKKYYFVGGMPEAVANYAENRDFKDVRKIQMELLKAYDKDFAKHAQPQLLPKIRLLWNSIPGQLAKENKKLIYTALRPGARAREYETALQWLDDAGMIRQVHRVSRPGIPLKAYEDFSAFKLYAHDVGLLGAMCGIKAQMLIEGHNLFTHFKGALTEQFVLQELVASGVSPYYWSTDEGMAEVEFIVQGAEGIYPLEVKAETNLQAKSLKSYRERFSPPKCLRTSLAEYSIGKFTDDIPLYAIGTAIRGYLE